MKRVLFLVASLCALLLAATPAAIGGNPVQDSTQGGGQLARGDCLGGTGFQSFALSAHARDDTATVGVGGTFNLSIPGQGLGCPKGHLVAKVDCLEVSGNMAELTARVTHSSGSQAASRPPGTEIQISVIDGGPMPDMLGIENVANPCDDGSEPADNVVIRGSIRVNDA